MRALTPILALAALGLSTPAAADVTARYAGSGKYDPTLTIAVADGGRARADAGPPNRRDERVTLIERDGIGYFAAADPSGRFVGRQDDFLALMDEMIRTAMPEEARGAMRGLAEFRLEIAPGGLETVAGRQGRVYTIAPIAPPPAAGNAGEAPAEASPGAPIEVVISEDPELAPVGREVARLYDRSSGLIASALGTTPAAVGQIRELLGRGTLIRFADAFRLRSVSTAPIPATAFDLPGPVLSREQLRARMPTPPPPTATTEESQTDEPADAMTPAEDAPVETPPPGNP